MGLPIAVSDWAAGRWERRGAFRSALAFLALAVIVTPSAALPLPVSYPVFAMLLAATVSAMGITALLLALQARALNSPATSVLAAGFAYSAATILVYALTYPGMLAPGIVAEPSSGGLWFLWHSGLLVAFLFFDRFRRLENNDVHLRGRAHATIVAYAVAFVGLTAVAILLPVPTTYADGAWTPVYTLFMAPLLVLMSLAVIALAVSRSRSTVLDLWIGVVALVMILDVYLTLVGRTRFTLGWYVSRAQMLAATCAILGVLLAQAVRLYAALVERAQMLEGEAHTDILTGLPNRRRFDEEFGRAFGSAVRRSSPLSIAMIDIDRFKRYNDAFGHQAGDDALHRIAQAIADSVDRSGDFAARYGGEEFVVILEDTGLDGAIAVAQRIRNTVLEAAIRAPSGGLLSVSVGVATRALGEPPNVLIGHADAALYEAKAAGRNRVIAFSERAGERTTA